MGVGKGLKAFLDAFQKQQELGQKAQYYALQLAYYQSKQNGKGEANVNTVFNQGHDAPIPGPTAGAPREGRSASSAVGGTVASDLPAHARAYLDAVASTESGGRYNVRYNGDEPATFNSYAQHPAVFVPGPAGPSSAAGRYQITKGTWDDMQGGAFTPANQDYAAWDLAKQRYADYTGGKGDLDAELQKNGLTPQIAKVLGPTWKGLESNPNLAISTYNKAYQSYQPTTTAALPIDTGRSAAVDPALTAAPAPPPRDDNLGRALPVEAGVSAPTPQAYVPDQGAIPVAYSGYDPDYTEAVYAAQGGLVPDTRRQWAQHYRTR